MRKCIWFFSICALLFMAAFVVREAIFRENACCADSVAAYREFHPCRDGGAERAVSDGLPERYGGVVLDADAGSTHFTYFVSVFDGHVAVFNWCGSLCRETSVVAGGLGAEVRALVQRGVYFNDIDDVNKFIEAVG